MSRNEDILQAYLDGTGTGDLPAPQSRIETILQAMIDGTSSGELPAPQSRNEALLLKVLDKINEGGGGGGGSGGSDDDGKGINFRDYDGTLLYTYTPQEFAKLEAMPENPDRTSEGLVAQGWNWSFENAKNYAAKYGVLEVGQYYDTIDGNTHIFVHIDEGLPKNRQNMTLVATVNSGKQAVCDWGDGSEPDIWLTGSFYRNHDYAPGDYEIVISGNYAFMTSAGSNGYTIYGTKNSWPKGYLSNAIRKVYIGSLYGTGMQQGLLQCCYALEQVTISPVATGVSSYFINGSMNVKWLVIPKSVTSVGDSAFYQCNLCGVSISDGVTNIGNSVFSDAGSKIQRIILPELVTTPASSARSFAQLISLKEIYGGSGLQLVTYMFSGDITLKSLPSIGSTLATIPAYCYQGCIELQEASLTENVKAIETSAFSGCWTLGRVSMPGVKTIDKQAFSSCRALVEVFFSEALTSIGTGAFGGCTSMSKYHFKGTTPPVLSGSQTFGSSSTFPKDCVIYVPYSEDHSVLEAYKTATNWSTYADHIQEEPQ